MSPQGVLSVEECATGIVNVAFDAATENGEFYQVQILCKIDADNIVGWKQTPLVNKRIGLCFSVIDALLYELGS